MTVAQSFGQDIRTWRERRGLTLPELAAKAGVSKGTLSKIENGKGDACLTTIDKLVRALEIEITFKP